GRGEAYSRVKVDQLLTIAEGRLPMGMDQWEAVASEYNVHFPRTPRVAESLRVKYKALKNMKKSTGDPTCPTPVKRAKRWHREIDLKMSTINFDDDDEVSRLEVDSISGDDHESSSDGDNSLDVN
ncbi:unnamed protein product, partial [Ectocarpus fasciculatus]